MAMSLAAVVPYDLRLGKLNRSCFLGSCRSSRSLSSSNGSIFGHCCSLGSSWRRSELSRYSKNQSSSSRFSRRSSRSCSPPVTLAGKRVHRATKNTLLFDVAKELAAQASMKDLEVKPKVDPKSVACMILGGGAGTRLFPLTKKRAKSAVPIGGAYRLIDIQMSNCINSCLNKVYVLTQFNSASLNRHISRQRNILTCRDKYVEVLAATQTLDDSRWSAGTADAVRRFSWIFDDVRTHPVEYVLILSGDHLYRMDYMDFVQSHHNSGADITVSCVPLSSLDGSEISPEDLITVADTGQISYAHWKDQLSTSPGLGTAILSPAGRKSENTKIVASMGVYVFRKDVLMKLLKWCYPKANHFETEVIPAAASCKDFDVQAYMFTGYWQDVGTIKSYFEANLALTEEPPKFEFYDVSKPIYTSPRQLPPTIAEHCRIVDSLVAHGCFLRNCRIKRSVVGIRSRIDNGVELNDTVILGAHDYETDEEREAMFALGKVPMGIGQNAKITKCIIDKDARIGRNVVLTNTAGIVEANSPIEGVYIRSGIIIVTEGALINDGVVL